MSQARTNRDNRNNKNYSPYNKQQKLRRGVEFDSYHYNRPYNKFQYYSAKYNFQPRWGYRRRRPPHHVPERQHSRSPSPFSGTEEYNMKKIQETSDMIKKRLMMPESDDVVDTPRAPPENSEQPNETDCKISKNENEKNLNKANKKVAQYNVGEIHHKIISHITNLSHGKKMNLICANSSGYDVAIQQIHKQKRLELSKVLRDMCSNQTVESSEVINAIIPDIGIKIEDLPLEVIQELSSTLHWNFEDASCSDNNEGTVRIKTELCENDMTVEEHSKDTITLPKEEESDVIDVNNIKREIDTDSQQLHPEFSEVDDETDFPMENAELSLTSLNPLEALCNIQQNNFKDIELELASSSDIEHNKTVTVSSQTDTSELKSEGIQTECHLVNSSTFEINKDNINCLDDAIKVMLEIDEEITRLTKMRQSIFAKIQKNEKMKENETVKKKVKNKGKSPTKHAEQVAKKEKSPQKHKATNKTINDNTQKSISETKSKNTSIEVNGDFDVVREEETYYDKPLNIEVISEKILVMKVVQNTLLAASEQGNIFYINTLDGTILNNIHVSEAPVISLCHWITGKGKLYLLVGSGNGKMHEFSYETRELLRVTNIKDCIQCMEVAWFHVFIGTTTGNLIRYSLKQCKIKFKEIIADDNIMVLKAAQEGARRVLLVGMRNAPVYIRDAMSGLRLRTMNELITPTVYNLILENSMVYCGTTAHDILVYTFHDGNLVRKYQATNSKGISCMRVAGNLLFASCYNGNIYAYDIKTHTFVGSIEGPGGVILSMEVVKNIVIVGTMSCNFKSILIPDRIFEHSKI